MPSTDGTRDGTLKAREWVFACEDLAMAALPAAFPRPQRHVEWTMLQLHYGDPKVHFELQPMVARGRAELGLHFEGTVEANDLWAAHIACHSDEVVAGLGSEWELEEWTASWRRLHRVFPFEKLTTSLSREVGAELHRALITLQPLVASGPNTTALAPPPRPQHRGEERNWRRKAKAAR